MSSFHRAAAVVSLWASAVAMIPQTTPSQKPPQAVFRSAVDLVHLDVSVLDRNRRPVRGLSAEDFTILEDGDVRPVAAFAELEVKAAAPPDDPKSWVVRAPADVQTNDVSRSPEGRLFVLILDDGLIPNDPQAIKTVREVAGLAVERLSPGDQMAVVFTVNSKGAQNFTSDRSKLESAIATFAPGHARHLMGWDTAVQEILPSGSTVWKLTMDHDVTYREGSVRTLELVAESLIAAPQRRKAIIYVSPGVLADYESAAQIVPIQPGQSMMNRQANSSLVARLAPLYRRMREANVTIYPVDPTGLGGLEAYVQRISAGLPPMAQARLPPFGADWFNLPAPPLPMELARRVSMVSLDFLKSTASNTGGVAITDTNDLAAGIDRVFSENESYYLLGFNVPPGHRPGSMHRLEVKVNRADVTVRTRSAYEVPENPPARQAQDGSKGQQKAGPSPAIGAVAGPIPAGPLPLRIVAAPFASAAGTGEPLVAIALGMDRLVSSPTPETFEVELRAFSSEGKSRLAERRTGQATLRPPAPGGDAFFDLLATVSLPPGRHELRIGAHLTGANLAGGLFADVVVPDFAKEALSLSGVLIETSGGDNGGPLDAFSAITNMAPTSRRAFTRRDNPRAFLRIYQGGDAPLAPVTVVVTVRDKSNELVFNYPYALPVAKFDSLQRSADFPFDFPQEALRSGPYLLTFQARMGTHTATRQVRFTFQ